MDKLLYRSISIVLLLSLIACGEPEESIIVEPVTLTCELSITFNYCADINCNSSEPVSGKEILIYDNEEDALLGIDPRTKVTTDTNGEVSINTLPCEVYYLKVLDEDHGTYLKMIRLSENSTLHHSILYFEGYNYQNNDELVAVQNHISLTNPRVGQVSQYQYHESFDSLYFFPDAYHNNKLTVTIIEDLGNNKFLVNERFDSLPQRIEIFYTRNGSDINNIWEIQEDSIHIYSADGGETSSFVWNIAWYAIDIDGYSTSLKSDPSGQVLDFEQSAYSTLGDRILDLSGEVKDFYLLGRQYQNSIYHVHNYTGWDGPYKLRVYSEEDGLIRWLNYFDGGSTASTYGLDLIVE